jgi:hypothetical protein
MPVFGLHELEHAFDKVIAEAAAVAQVIVAESAATVEAAAKANFQGSHAKGQPHVGGDKPNVVTGTARRSIRHEPVRSDGLAGAHTRVGPTVSYFRRLELGFSGVDSLGRRYDQPGYPSFEPAVKSTKDPLEQIARTHWTRATRSP